MNQNNQPFIKPAIIIVIIAGILGAFTTFTEGIGPGAGKIFVISLLIILYGITATICIVVSNKPEYKGLGTAGMISSAGGFLVAFIAIVAEIGDTGILQIAFALFIASIALAHICLLHYFTLQNKYALYARITGTIAIAIFSLLLILRIFEPIPSFYALAYNQSTLKILMAALMIDLAATLLVPLCNRLPTPSPVDDLLATPVEPEQTEAIPPAQPQQPAE